MGGYGSLGNRKVTHATINRASRRTKRKSLSRVLSDPVPTKVM